MNRLQKLIYNMAGRPAPKVEQEESQRGYYVGDYMSYMAQFGNNAVTVTPANSLQSSAIYSIVDRKASTIASLPIKIVKKDGPKREMVDLHDQNYLLSKSPNSLYTAFIYWRTIIGNLELWGNAFSKITRNQVTGRPVQYTLWAPNAVEIILYKTQEQIVRKVYHNQITNEFVDEDDILHFSDLSLDGLRGASKIQLHADLIHFDRSATRMGKNVFENGTFLGGYIKYPQTLNEGQLSKYRESFADVYSGMQNAGKVGALDGGSEFVPLKMTMPFSDIAYIENRNLTKEELAMIFNYPVELLGHSKTTASSFEQIMIQYVTSSLTPMVTMIEQELNRKVFRQAEAINHSVKFEMNGLLRGDTRARAEFYKTMFNIAGLSADEIRALENMSPIPGGDQYFVQTNNLMPLDKVSDYFTAKIQSEKK